MKAITLSFLLTGSLVTAASGQVLIEHAAAVAGATAGTVGGKVLSNAIDKTLGKAAGVASATEAKSDKKTDPATAAPAKETAGPALKQSGRSAGPDSGAGSARKSAAYARAAKHSTNRPVFEVERSMPSPMVPAVVMTPPPPSASDIAKIREGISRDEVFAALGVPSSHVTIPDDGHLIEILTYSNGGERIGSIHVDNGQVVSVTAVSPK